MVYEYITDPKTQEKVSLNTKRGIKILTNYIQQQNSLKNIHQTSDRIDPSKNNNFKKHY